MADEPNKTNAALFRSIKEKRDQLVLAATDLAAIILPYGVDPGDIVDPATGDLVALPESAESLGEIQKQAGVDLSPDMKTEGIMGYGSRAQRRVFVTEESFDIDLTVQEIRANAYKMFMSIADEDVENGAFSTKLTKRASGDVKYYGLVLIAKDLARTGEIFPFWFFPKVAVTKKGKMSLAEASEMGMPLTFSVFEENEVMFTIGLGGKGWPELAKTAGFTEGEDEEADPEGSPGE